MSIFYGYEEYPKLSTTGGKMTGDLNMNYWALKNIAAPVDDFDAISKKVLDVTLEKINSKWKVLFNLNVTDEAGNIETHNNGRVSLIGTGNYRLIQSDPVYAPVLGTGGFLSPDLTTNPINEAGMIFNLPKAQYCDLNVFIVARRAQTLSNIWEILWSNDDGNYDKFIGYKCGTNDKLAYGGGYPRKEYVCTIPNNIDTTKKHLISAHWQLSNSHIRVNGLNSIDSDFTSNNGEIGYPYSSILSNIRGPTKFISPALSEFYGIKIIVGYMTELEISNVCSEMIKEYNITN